MDIFSLTVCFLLLWNAAVLSGIMLLAVLWRTLCGRCVVGGQWHTAGVSSRAVCSPDDATCSLWWTCVRWWRWQLSCERFVTSRLNRGRHRRCSLSSVHIRVGFCPFLFNLFSFVIIYFLIFWVICQHDMLFRRLSVNMERVLCH